MFCILALLFVSVNCSKVKEHESIGELLHQVIALSETIAMMRTEMSSLKTENQQLKLKIDDLILQNRGSKANSESNNQKNSCLNDTDLEERVEALEFQMVNVHGDIDTINTALLDLEEDVESQIT